MSEINQKEYLKKYLSIGKESKKKKKRKIKKTNGLKIIDYDDEAMTEIVREDLLADNEDAPQIVAIIDDRPPSLRIDEKSSMKLWIPIGGDDSVKIEAESAVSISKDKLPVKRIKKEKGTEEIQKISVKIEPKSPVRDTNISPIRRNPKDSDDKSPPRKSLVNDFSDNVVVKQEIESDGDGDISSPRKQTRRDRDISPVRRKVRDISPTRKQSKVDKVGDISPVRQKDRDISPKRRQYELDKDGDISPVRRKDREISPPRRHTKDNSRDLRIRQDEDGDFSPVRRKNRNRSPPRHTRDLSPRRRTKDRDNSRVKLDRDGDRKKDRDISPPKKKQWSKRDRDTSPPRKSSGLRRKDGAVSPVRDKDMKDTTEAPQVERISLRDMVRPKKKNEEPAIDEATKEKYTRWGAGLKQVQDMETRIAEELHEMNKPLARYANDEDLDKYLKEQEREGDPMLEYLRKKRKKKDVEEGKPSKPTYLGEFMPNRFGIRPGHRWDGVDRSNGYEKRWFEVQNSKTAQIEESYKWSTEDM